MERKKTESQATARGSLRTKASNGKAAKTSETKTAKPSVTSGPPLPPVEPPPTKVLAKPKPKGTCYVDTIPGPGTYGATCTVGYYGHDPTKTREPAFSFATGGRKFKNAQLSIPGPKYNLDEVTRFGPAPQTGPVITGRLQEFSKGHLTPGPGHYSPEKFDNPRYHNAPEARLLARLPASKISRFTPGPGNYHVPSTVGDSHPTYTTAQSALIFGRSWDKEAKNKKSYIPGPNQYNYDNAASLRSGPSARLMGRESLKRRAESVGPGPGAYYADFVRGVASPGFSFGRKHAPCVFVPLENE